ncbi:OmpA family protein [Oligoflexus tunisiensis]|uniref:OmpA family protein n=1 Tax=Oligoflexus tunisiensis TaxID=708132 RepID=UPI00114CCFDF|nr:OmpA family protein [Oligoflexus tunisiensis]
MKLTLTTCAMVLAVLSPAAFSAQKNCQITFEYNSARVDARALDVCVDILDLKSGDRLRVDAFASKEGASAHNLKLSQQRARAVTNALKKRVKGLDVKARGYGERDFESRVAILITGAEDETGEPIPGTRVAALGTSDAIATRTATTSGTQGRWRAALRSGFDTTRIEDRAEYFAPGLDVAYVPAVHPNVRLEAGVLASLYAEGNRNRLGSWHFAPMAGYQNAGYVAGVRGLAGVVHSYETDRNFTDTGAELRLGVERDQWSLFVGAGRSSTLDRFGMDFGVRF